MKNLLLLCLCSLLSISLYAQSEETVFGKTGLRVSGAWGGWTNGLSQHNDDFAVYSGGFGGLEFNRKIFIGWGSSKLVDDVRLEAFPDNDLDFKYNGLMLGAMFGAHKIVHPKISLLTGRGKIDLNNIGTDRVYVFQPAVGVEFNIFRWFHLSLDGGYRIVTNTNIEGLNDSALSAPFGEIKFKFGWSWRNW